MQLSPWMKWGLKGAPVLLVVLYCADWAVFGIRLAHGSAVGSVQVRHFMSTPLKNHRDEFDLVDSAEQACVHSGLPHQGLSPCWWVQLHRDQWESI
jgi:hypothetical protein